MQYTSVFFRLALAHPEFVPSFLFYRTMRALLRRLYSLYASIASRKQLRWRITGADTLKNPLALPVIMTTGPRWNTHAITASAGPVRVERNLQANVSTASHSAQNWTIVVYSFPDSRTIATIDSLTVARGTVEYPVMLQPGRYTLILRYYHWHETVTLPAIQTDNRPAIPETPVSARNNDFLNGLDQRGNWFYLWLHAYIYPMLLWQDQLPAAFVRREFLPVGNPETYFYYGALRQGEALRCTFDEQLWNGYDIFLTVYNRRSFPLFWYQLSERQHTTEPLTRDGFYLFRCHPRIATGVMLTDDQTLLEPVTV